MPENVERICDGHILSNLVHLWKSQCCNGLRTALFTARTVSPIAFHSSQCSIWGGYTFHIRDTCSAIVIGRRRRRRRTSRGSSDVPALHCLPAGVLNGHGATELATRVAGKPIASQRIASRSYLCPEHTLSACASSSTPPCLAAGTGERPRSAARTSSRPRELA